MERLSVFRLKRAPDQMVLVVSDPHIATAGTVVAAPLMNLETFPVAPVLNPVLDIGGMRLALATEQLAAIPVKELGALVASGVDYEYPIANAVNRLFFGI
jgi:hypothetical protein